MIGLDYQQVQKRVTPGGLKAPGSLYVLLSSNLITYKSVCEFAPLKYNINSVISCDPPCRGALCQKCICNS